MRNKLRSIVNQSLLPFLPALLLVHLLLIFVYIVAVFIFVFHFFISFLKYKENKLKGTCFLSSFSVTCLPQTAGQWEGQLGVKLTHGKECWPLNKIKKTDCGQAQVNDWHKEAIVGCTISLATLCNSLWSHKKVSPKDQVWKLYDDPSDPSVAWNYFKCS